MPRVINNQSVPIQPNLFTLSLPADATILCVQMQSFKGEVPCIWYSHDRKHDSQIVSFQWFDTGIPFDSPCCEYIGTINGWHLFKGK